MTHFWAKTTPEGKPGISVLGHMGNVGCVAHEIAELNKSLLEKFLLNQSVVAALVALHDLGKISPGFQRKSEIWLEENNLIQIDRNYVWDTAMEPDHGKVTHSALQKFLLEIGINRKSAKYLSTIIGAHHGRLKARPDDRGYKPRGHMNEERSGIDWDKARNEAAHKIWKYFNVSTNDIHFTDDSPGLWWLAGLTSVADWIGSDERFFPTEIRNTSFDPYQNAKEALTGIGFHKPDIIKNLDFEQIFGFPPNEMQSKVLATVNQCGVYVIEAPMGMGKTEAALGAAYQLLSANKASGIYFALPTQMTSNRIHLRMNTFLSRITASNKSRLVHGNSWLIEGDLGIHPSKTTKNEKAGDDARVSRDWFVSTKRGLIAPFGVGTIDQALLGVVAAKHFFVRHFALAGKVVILDEIHSYDLYTGTLIDKLISTLEKLRCTVIILSATLTGKRRRQMLSLSEDDSNQSDSYPLITGLTAGGNSIKPVVVTPSIPRNVKVNFIDMEKANEEALLCAKNGGSVLWVCNTVDNAQKCYQKLREINQGHYPIGLMHSRFPFWRREQLEMEWMERFGKESKTRCGSILIATQVVEQSVDLDADLLITELAPTDMILQRLGRLWRHERGKRPVEMPQLYILEEEKSLDEFRNMDAKAIENTLGSKAKVYAPYILLRTLEVWKEEKLSNVMIPLKIRELIETTYVDKESEPEAWQNLADSIYGQTMALRQKALMSSNIWQPALEDEEGVQTRINEIPTVSVVLCSSIDESNVCFIDGAQVKNDSEDFNLSAARGIHKNLVKVPNYCFEKVEPCDVFEKYLRGAQTIGLLENSGYVNVKGLNTNRELFYSDDLGLVIKKLKG